jgi:hypothetical protein
MGLFIVLVLLSFIVTWRKKDQSVPETGMTVTPSISWHEPNLSDFSDQAQKKQSDADYDFGTWQEKIQTNYPWYNNLPLQTKDYFVYFDLDTQTFIAQIYTQTNAQLFRKEIENRLIQEGIDITKFHIIWK